MTRIKRNGWIFALALCIPVGATAAVAWQGSGEVYKRYVSPPLADGTRCTFLYPARYSEVITAGHTVGNTTVGGNGIVILRTPQVKNEVQQQDLSSQGLGSNKALQESQRYGMIMLLAPGTMDRHLGPPRLTEHLASVTRYDPRTGLVLKAGLSGDPATEQSPRFKESRRVLQESLQILPPGAPVPSP